MKWLLFIVFSMGVCYSQQARLEIYPLTMGFYVFTTYGEFKDQLFPANGMYVVTNNGVVMIDTPWDTSQTRPLLDSIEKKHQLPVLMCISTHFHDDRTAGVNILRQKGIKTFCSMLTFENGKKAGEKLPEFLFYSDTTFQIGGIKFQTFYPGKGHTSDNIVVWFPDARVLYGGCFIKSRDAKGMGNLADADINEWPHSIKKTIRKFKSPQYVIPGHEGWYDKKALQHTLRLIKAEIKILKKKD